MVLKVLAILVLVHSACSSEYYWRDYEPSCTYPHPSDALVGGKDVNNESVYIGQTNIWGHAGVHTATISPGKEVWVSYAGPKRATNFMQILCTDQPSRFKWVPATATDLHLVGMNTHIVRGGMEQDHITYVGRVKHQGNIVIGKVYTHVINNSEMVFISNGKEYRVKSYEILTYT